MGNNRLIGRIDYQLLIIYIVLVLIGWLNIYSAVYNESHKSIFDISQSYGRQLIWIASSFFIALIILLTNSRFFQISAYVIYALTLLLLISVLGIGATVSGSKSWFEIGSFRLQPSEFAKFATNLALAKLLSASMLDMKKIKNKIITLLIIGTPALLILLQNDTGSALVYSSFILVLYRFGLPNNLFFGGLWLIVLAVSTLWIGILYVSIATIIIALFVFFNTKKNSANIKRIVWVLTLSLAFIFSVEYVFDNVLEAHQKTRIKVLLGNETDLKGVGYNVNQSKIAIGSGGFFGKGYLKGTQTKYNFVPEQSTDFIFCTIGEEWGFLGTITILSLFFFLLYRVIIVAERQRSLFGIIFGYGVFAIIFFHVIINIGMTIGLVPVIGIPLPFLSYGGSSLWSFTILLFIFIKIDADRSALF